MTNYETVSTHDLRVGDTVYSDGMVLLIDQEIVQSKAHPVTDYGGACLYTAARVLNFEEIEAAAESGHSVFRMLRSFIRDDMSPNGHLARNGRTPYEVPRWTIQGNGLARWSRAIQEV